MFSFSLAYGVFAFPLYTNANIFSNLFGNSAEAEIKDENINNSQNITLLEASPSNFSLMSKNNGEKINNNIEINISNDSLLPSVGPLGVSVVDDEEFYDFSPSGDINIYVVKPGDSVADIAKMFDVSTNTILWANELKKGEKLKVGDALIILPVDGVKHVVKKGETVSIIAKSYEVESKDIYEFNDIGEKDFLSVGQEIIIPGAVLKETEAKKKTISSSTKKTTISSTTSTSKITPGGSIPNNYYSSNNTRRIPGYFIKPISCGLTQGKHNRYAVDLSCGFGTPIKAAASGKVIFAKVGWNGAFGNLVIIQHPNNTQTFYSHLSKINVSIGEQVSQGEIIGNVGNTGRVRKAPGGDGSHLHFEVRGAWNPGFDNSWAR